MVFRSNIVYYIVRVTTFPWRHWPGDTCQGQKGALYIRRRWMEGHFRGCQRYYQQMSSHRPFQTHHSWTNTRPQLVQGRTCITTSSA